MRATTISSFGGGNTYIQKIQLDGTQQYVATYGSNITYISCLINRTRSSGLSINRMISSDLLIKNSTGGIDSGLTINNCTSHAIELINSSIYLNGAIAGTGNGGAGVYAHDRSLLKTKSGTPPTITGRLVI